MLIKYYTKSGCHLCEEGYEALLDLNRTFPFMLEVVDIMGNDNLIEQYGMMIPVVEVENSMMQFGSVDKNSIKRMLLHCRRG